MKRLTFRGSSREAKDMELISLRFLRNALEAELTGGLETRSSALYTETKLIRVSVSKVNDG